MKRITALILTVVCVCSASPALAAEVKMQGQFDHLLEWRDKTGTLFQENTGQDDFTARQRIRMYFDYIASDNVHAVVGFEIDQTWGGGTAATGGTWGNDQTAIVKVKHAYTDFKIGRVDIRVGLQPVSLPGAVAGSPVLGEDVFGILASHSFTDTFGLTVAWLRLRGEAGDAKKIDATALIAPITMDGWDMAPYFVYSWHGHNAAVPGGLASLNATSNTKNYSTFWLGTSFNMTMFDPVTILADFAYGATDTDAQNNDRKGWYFLGEVDYKLDMFTPGVLFSYGSGDDEDLSNGSGAMPILQNNTSFGPSSFGYSQGPSLSTDAVLLRGQRLDMMTLGFVAKDISFLEKMTHTFRIFWGRGTSDKRLGDRYVAAANTPLFTEKDSFWEVNFDTFYTLHEALSLNTYIGYINPSYSSDSWLNASANKPAARVAFSLQYRF